MSVNSPSGRITQSLAEQLARGADAAGIADAVIASWQAIDAALSPIIGHPSVAVLYVRSRHLAGRNVPWLRPTGTAIVMDLPALRALLAEQDVAAAAAGAGELLQTFYELLSSLVGPSLTARLLVSVWTPPSSGSPAQDTLP